MKTHRLLILIFQFITYSGFSQFNPWFPSSIIDDNGDYRYLAATSEPHANWKNPDFDDSSWTTGYKSIGWGDNDDRTEIDPCNAVYIRIAFDIDHIEDEYNLIVDYDDAFVAYWNGVEITRANLGQSNTHVPYNALSDRSHEAINYRQYDRPVQGFYIDKQTIDQAAKIGKNILAVQIHNDSLMGSDLSFNAKLISLNEWNFSVYNSDNRFFKRIHQFTSNHPIIVIETDEYGISKDKTDFRASMGIIDNGYGETNSPGQDFSSYIDRIEIETRGKTSIEWPKKSYNFETQDSDGENLNISLLGMPAENDWILYGPFSDKSLIRNTFAFEIGRRMGQWAPRNRFCELIINGDYVGLYALTEKIKQDKNRLNISKAKPDDFTGGYIFKYDKPEDDHPDETQIQIEYPKSKDILPEQEEYITSFVDNFQQILDSPKFLNKTEGYRRYIDIHSLIDYILINETLRNCDSYLYSFFMHKNAEKIDDRIKFGPLWDYDYTLGNVNFMNADQADGWHFEINNSRIDMTKIMRDTDFVHQMNDRWNSLRKTTFHTDSLLNLFESIEESVKEARIRNYEIWPVISKNIVSYAHLENYDQEINAAKEYLTQRLNWIDNNIDKIYYQLPAGFENSISNKNCSQKIKVYPNPFTNHMFVRIDTTASNFCTIEIRKLQGRLIKKVEKQTLHAGSNILYINELSDVEPGIYSVQIIQNNYAVSHHKMIKIP